MSPLIPEYNWLPIKDGDPRALAICRKHYSFYEYKDGRREKYGNKNRFRIVGPGERILLMTPECDALFCWRKFIDKSGEEGVNNNIFCNLGHRLSSTLILEAEQLAWHKWPGARLYTYIDDQAIKSKGQPGYCYQMARWRLKRETGNKAAYRTKSGKLVYYKLP